MGSHGGVRVAVMSKGPHRGAGMAFDQPTLLVGVLDGVGEVCCHAGPYMLYMSLLFCRPLCTTEQQPRLQLSAAQLLCVTACRFRRRLRFVMMY